MKKHVKLILFFIIFITSLSSVFALEAEISLDNNEVNINDNIKFQLSISSDKGGEIKIDKNIAGIDDNFDIIQQYQSQKNEGSYEMINGKTQYNSKIIYYLNYVLKPKDTGDFELGPVIIYDGDKKIKTNSVKLKVSGTKLFINNNSPNLNTNTKKNIDKLDEQKYEDSDSEKINYYFVSLSFLILILLLIIFIIIKSYYKNILDYFNKINLINKKQENKKELNNEEDEIKNNINFEDKIKKEEYPDINDNLFIEKIDNIFRYKIAKKINISNIENFTYEEILKNINKNIEEKQKEQITKIIKLLNRAKYSNLITNNGKILEKVKNLFE